MKQLACESTMFQFLPSSEIPIGPSVSVDTDSFQDFMFTARQLLFRIFFIHNFFSHWCLKSTDLRISKQTHPVNAEWSKCMGSFSGRKLVHLSSKFVVTRKQSGRCVFRLFINACSLYTKVAIDSEEQN